MLRFILAIALLPMTLSLNPVSKPAKVIPATQIADGTKPPSWPCFPCLPLQPVAAVEQAEKKSA
jgi:hypothetical protein